MSEFLVLLRGVNVGKGNRVPMADFKCMLEAMGCIQVQTLLNSGNAIFHFANGSEGDLAQAIAQSLQERLGIRTPVIVKTRAALEQIIAENPMPVPETAHSQFLVAFGADPAALATLSALRALNRDSEQLELTLHAGYLHCRTGLLESLIGKAMLGKAGRLVTTRNWATVLKLAALFTQAPRTPKRRSAAEG